MKVIFIYKYLCVLNLGLFCINMYQWVTSIFNYCFDNNSYNHFYDVPCLSFKLFIFPYCRIMTPFTLDIWSCIFHKKYFYDVEIKFFFKHFTFKIIDYGYQINNVYESILKLRELKIYLLFTIYAFIAFSTMIRCYHWHI